MSINKEQASWFADAYERLVANVDQAILGKQQVIRLALCALFSQGHLLLEDYPGTGKTVLAYEMAIVPVPAAGAGPARAGVRRGRRRAACPCGGGGSTA